MVTIEKIKTENGETRDHLVIRLDFPAENLPDFQKALIRQLRMLNESTIRESKQFNDDLYFISHLLESMMLNEMQTDKAFEITDDEPTRLKFKMEGNKEQ